MNHRSGAPAGEAASDATRVMGQGQAAPARGSHFAPRDPFSDVPPANPYPSAAPSETVMMPGASARRNSAAAAPVNARPVEPATGYFPYSEESQKAERRPLFGGAANERGFAARPLERVPFSGLAKTCIAILVALAVLSAASNIVTGFINGGSTANTATTDASAQIAQSAAVDLSDIPGQYWSNAKKILKSRGADVDGAVVLTDDGSTPLVASNWIVQSIYYNDNGNLEVNLARSGSDQSGDGGISSALQNLGGQVQNALNALQSGVSGATTAP